LEGWLGRLAWKAGLEGWLGRLAWKAGLEGWLGKLALAISLLITYNCFNCSGQVENFQITFRNLWMNPEKMVSSWWLFHKHFTRVNCGLRTT
jgi:hypothetical protein